MLADIITIGDEILIGQIVDTNSAWIGEKLTEYGFKVRQITSVADTEETILDSLKDASKISKLVIITGGLGPTKDDRTKAALCKYFETSLRMDEASLQRVETFVSMRGGTMNELNKAQALVPANCKVIPNHQGTAPGMWFEKKGTVFISMPGVPFEMKLMMEESVLPWLKEHFSLPAIFYKTLLIQGIPEAQLAIQLDQWETNLPQPLQLAYLPSPGYIRLRIGGLSENAVQLKALVETEIKKLYEIIPQNIVSKDFQQIEIVVGQLLRKGRKTIATAESCTGGNIARVLTSTPGSSDYFKGSVVAYANDIKERVLGVKHEDLLKHGAVSRKVAEQMAKGARELLQTDYAISTSGIAGPTGGSDEKPVGTTWIAVASKDKMVSEMFRLGNLRETNIAKASMMALSMLVKMVDNGAIDH